MFSFYMFLNKVRSKTGWLECRLTLRNYHRWVLVIIELVVIGLANPVFWGLNIVAIPLFIVSVISALFDIAVSIAERIVWRRIPQEKENPTPRARFIVGDFTSAAAFFAIWIWQVLVLRDDREQYSFYGTRYNDCEILGLVGSLIIWYEKSLSVGLCSSLT